MAQPSGIGRPNALRVLEITIYFWIITLSTAMGEATSDYLSRDGSGGSGGNRFRRVRCRTHVAVSRLRYVAWSYWLAVVMVGVFGTMAANVLHVGFHVPYVASSALYAVIHAAVFVVWGRSGPSTHC